MMEKLRPRRPDTTQVLAVGGGATLKGYWPERNPKPLFQIDTSRWMNVESLVALHDLLGKVIEEAKAEPSTST